ncbi:MAG: flagellar hook-basal body complex protein FliE [Phycisphaerae bacterium]
MAGINPVSGAGPTWPQAATGPGRAAGGAGEQQGFSNLLKTYVENVDSDQRASAQAIQDLISGKTNDVLPVVESAAQADMSFKLLMGVRNKVIEAYKQTMNMQI